MIRPGAKFRNAQLGAICALTLSFALTAAASPREDSTATASEKSAPAKKTASTSSHTGHSSSSKTTSKRSHKKPRGQQKIDSERAQAIQEALIREHYLSGEAKGTWNQASEDAMRRYQADHGWQSKTVPDSRALISLGLGPSKDHLLNPESAMTTVPDRPKSNSALPTSHTPAANAAPLPSSSASPAATSTPPASETRSPQ